MKRRDPVLLGDVMRQFLDPAALDDNANQQRLVALLARRGGRIHQSADGTPLDKRPRAACGHRFRSAAQRADAQPQPFGETPE